MLLARVQCLVLGHLTLRPHPTRVQLLLAGQLATASHAGQQGCNDTEGKWDAASQGDRMVQLHGCQSVTKHTTLLTPTEPKCLGQKSQEPENIQYLALIAVSARPEAALQLQDGICRYLHPFASALPGGLYFTCGTWILTWMDFHPCLAVDASSCHSPLPLILWPGP